MLFCSKKPRIKRSNVSDACGMMCLKIPLNTEQEGAHGLTKQSCKGI
jgi:hypothetical protein